MTANPNKPLVPYLRQSRKGRERSISIDEQRRDIARWAKQAGVKLGAEVVEQNVSGSKSWRERELGAAIRACEEGLAGGVIVAWQDRLSRENGLGTAEVWNALERAGARLVCAAEGLDTANGDQELTFHIKAAIARDQWKRHATNWKRAKHSAWERGVYNGSAPTGYRVSGGELVQGADTERVREAFKLRARGGSWGKTAEVLGLTKNGARQVIANPVYKGVHTCTCGCGQETRREAWVLVAPSVWGKAQPRKGEPMVKADQPEWLLVYDPVRGVSRVPNPDYRKPENGGRPLGRAPGTGRHLLSGLARCAGCGSLMQVGSTRLSSGRRLYTYRCQKPLPSCPAPATISAEPVERLVIEETYRRLGGRAESAPVDVAPLDAAVEEAEQELRAFTLNVPATTPGYAEAVAARTATLQQAQDALEDARQGSGVSYFTQEHWHDAFADEGVEMTLKQAALREQLPGGITVRRGRGMKPEEKVLFS